MKNLSLKAKLWIYAGICIGVILYLVYTFITQELAPYRIESENLNRELEMKKIELSKIMTQNQRKGELQQEIKQAAKDFEKLKEMFPDKDFIPKRLQDLTKAARFASVSPVSFKPSRIVEREFYVENHYDISVESSYHGLGAFFQEIANFKYPTGVTKVSISQHRSLDNVNKDLEMENITSTINASFQLKTYTSKK